MPGDVCFAFEDVEGAPYDTVPITAIEVGVADDAVFVELPDGARFSFGEFFSNLLSTVVIDSWKSISTGAHTPRISVGRFTISRQTWRVDVAAEPFTRPASEFELYRAVRRWQESLDLPDRVYVKLPGEVKPLYLDFGSPVLVLSFLAVLRSALGKPNGSSEIVVSEALPDPKHAWVAGESDNRYLGEIRLLVFHEEDLAPRERASPARRR